MSKDNTIKITDITKTTDTVNITNTFNITDTVNITNTTNSNIIKRVFTCCLCNNPTSHNLRQCNEFKKNKENITKKNYFLHNTISIKANDEIGFCASGIIPYCIVDNNIYILLLIETRGNMNGLNFIAGGRESIEVFDNNKKNIRQETSYETALNECKEELEEILLPSSLENIMNEIKTKTPTACFWSYISKMVLYTVQVNNSLLHGLEFNSNKSNTSEADNFIWIKLSEYNKYIYKNINKSDNTKSDSIKSINTKLDGIKLDSVKLDDIKLDDTKLDNIKLDDIKLDNTKLNDTKSINTELNNNEEKIYFHKFIKDIIYNMKNLSHNHKTLNYLFQLPK